MSRKKEILNQVGVFSAATILSQAITLVAALLSRRFLGPTSMGIWAFIQIVLTYASFSALGVTNATSREIPLYRGRGDEKKADEIKNIVTGFSLSTSLLISFGILFTALIFRAGLETRLYHGLLFASMFVVLQRVNDLLISLLRAYKQFAIESRQMVYSALVNAAAVALLAYAFDLYGFMWAMLLSFLFNSLYVLSKYDFKFRWQLQWQPLKGLVSYGFPLMMLGLMSTFFITIDKLMITTFLGFEALGLYGVAILGMVYMEKIPNAVGIVLLPNFQERYGERNNAQDLKSYIVKSTFAFYVTMPIFVAFGWFLFPVCIQKLLPAFVESIGAVKILLLSSFFTALSHPYDHFIIAVRKHWYLFPIVFVSSLLAILFNYLAIRGGYGIGGVALATTLTLMLKFSAMYYLTGHHIFSMTEGWLHYLSILGTFVFMVVILLALDRIFRFDLWPIQLVSQFSVFCLAFGPFLVKLNQEFGYLQVLQQKLFGKAPAYALDSENLPKNVSVKVPS